MSFAPIRRPRLNQPSGDGIDWNNKHSDGLVFSFSAGAGGVNLVSGRKGVPYTANMITGVAQLGKFIQGTGGGNDRFLFSESLPAHRNGWTMLIEAYDPSAFQSVMAFRVAGLSGYRVSNGNTGASPSVFVENVNGFAPAGMTGLTPRYCIAASSRGASASVMAINGVCGADFAASNGNPFPAGECEIYLPFDNGTSKIFVAHLWNRELTNEALSSMTSDPRQVFL